MFNKLKDNPQFQIVVDRCQQALDGANITPEDFENICLITYAYQETKATPYGLDMEKAYSNLSKLEGIYFKEGDYFIDGDDLTAIKTGEFAQISDNITSANDGHLAILSDNAVISDARISAIYLNEDEVRTPEERREALAHELNHLFQAVYQYDENGKINVEALIVGSHVDSSIVEAVTQSSALSQLEFLEYEVPGKTLSVIAESGDEKCVVPTIGNAYQTIVPYAIELERIDGKALYQAVYDNVQYNGELNLDRFGKILRNSDISFDANIKLVDTLRARTDLMLVSGQIDNIQYLQELGHLDKLSPILHTRTEDIQMVSAATDAKVVDMFYTSPDGSKHLEDLNHQTRSEDCKNFLIAIQGLRALAADGKIDLTQEGLDNMSYYATSSFGSSRNIQIMYEGQLYEATATICSEYGTSRIKNISETDAKKDEISIPEQSSKISFTKLIESKEYFNDIEVIVSQRPSSSEMPLYISCVCASDNSPNLMNMSSMMSYSGLSLIRDVDGNNVAHILAENNSVILSKNIRLLNEKELSGLLITPNDEGITPIDTAISSNNPYFFKAATTIPRLPDVNYENESGTSPLIESIVNNVHPYITKVLLENFDADPNTLTTYSVSALNAGIESGNETKIKLLIENGADFDFPSYVNDGTEIYTPLEVISGMSGKEPNYELFRTALSVDSVDIFEPSRDGISSVYEHMVLTQDTNLLIIAAENGYIKTEHLEDFNLSEEQKDAIVKQIDVLEFDA